MLKVTHIQRCNCGAIPLTFENDASNSMYEETFEKIKDQLDLSEAEELQNCYCCNHCVNHWGIDLCECGSGERVGECECGSNSPFQTLGDEIDHIGLILKGLGRC